MTPSNPSNQNPFILCIMDALGIPHQVAPLEHTHSYAEVPGLADEISELWAGLNEKANQEDMTEALEGKQDALTFDTTPTANSTNPVTSGGVKAAIDDATKAVFGSMPYYITAAHEKMYVHTRILRNNTGSTIKLTECIDVSALPAAERHVYWNSPDIDLPNNTEIGIRFVRTSNAIFLYYDGNFDY